MPKEKELHCPDCGAIMIYHDMSASQEDSYSLEETVPNDKRNADVGGN